MGLRAVEVHTQLKEWDSRVTDPRARVSTGWTEVDGLLHRGGLSPSTLCLLGGRTGTRKTTMTVNLILRYLEAGHSVGFVTLDESRPSYVAKIASAMSGMPFEFIEENWTAPQVERVKAEYAAKCKFLSLSEGYRPDFGDLSSWRAMASAESGLPAVVFIDYTSLLTRDRYAGGETQRVVRLIEELQVWTNEEEVVTFALHQIGRETHLTQRLQHGHLPLVLEDLRNGGEEIADLVFATYRPAKEPLGNMTEWQAQMSYGDDFDYEKWERAVATVKRYEQSTFLQLLKNRPGTRLCDQGIEFLSVGESQKMSPASEQVGNDGRMRA